MALFQNKKKMEKEPIKKTAQQTIPYKAMYENGVAEMPNGLFSKMYPLEDVNFKIASQEEQDAIFLKFGELLNMFGNEVSAQITIFNRTILKENFEEEILIKMRGDDCDELREEVNTILLNKMQEGKNNLIKEKYITVTVQADSIDSANADFSRLDGEVSGAIKRINGVDTFPLRMEERLAVLYDIYHSGSGTPFIYTKQVDGVTVKSVTFEDLESQGLTTKDAIAPSALQFERDHFISGDVYGQTMYIQTLKAYLSTDFIHDISDLDCNMVTSVHFESLRQDKAVKLIRNYIVNVNGNVIDKQKRATRSGYSPDLISPDLIKQKEDGNKILNDVTARNQKLFYVTFVVTHFANDLETLKKQSQTLKMIAAKSLVTLAPLTLQQEWGFTTSLPLGYNKISTKRLLTTEQASLFIPFSTQEARVAHGIYYGLNAISRNLIVYDRRKGMNSNGMILGTSGSGKSFSAKREMLSVRLSTDDDIMVIDPDREYSALCQMVGGVVVKIAAGATDVYINPMDLDMRYADGDNPITLKSDFICSLFETISGTRYGLSDVQKSIIDRCVKEVYRPYVEYMQKHKDKTFEPSRCPTLKHLYDIIRAQPEIEARNLATSIERFVTGSYDIFAHRSNIDINNRFVVYDIKDIGNNLKTLGIQVCLNDIWNRTIANKARGKRTWFYIDEFYLLTQNEASSCFLQEIFKRARKWLGVPTGITQNVEDLLKTQEVRSMISNCNFIMMLNQSPNDKYKLTEMFNLSPMQLSYITGADSGQGLLYFGDSGKVIPFVDKYPRDTKTYKIMSTRLEDK